MWAFKDSYVRFAAKIYNAKSTDKFAHLTNNCVVKKFMKNEAKTEVAAGDSEGSDEGIPDYDNIWSSDDFGAHLQKEYSGQHPESQNIYRDIIWP